MTKEHIIYTLGINVPTLTESLNDNKNSLQLILEEQMLYESFLDSVKTYAKEKWDKVVTTIKDWKDVAAAIGKFISSENIDGILGAIWRYGVQQPLKSLKTLLDKVKLGDFYTNKILPTIKKISQLKGWKGFIVILSIGSIIKYITSKLTNLSAEGLKKWILAYFSDEAIDNILSKLTNFSTFLGWIQPIVKGVEIIFDILKSALDRINREDQFPVTPLTTESYNIYNKNKLMKNEVLKKLIKEEIKDILKEEEFMSAADLARSLKQTSVNLDKNPKGIQGLEPKAINQMINLLIEKSKSGTLSSSVINKIIRILSALK